jgi:hypothetical protein
MAAEIERIDFPDEDGGYPVDDSPMYSTIALLTASCESMNAWFQSRKTSLKMSISIEVPNINIVCTSFNVNTPVSTQVIDTYSTKTVYGLYQPEHVIQRLVSGIIQSRNQDFILRLVEPSYVPAVMISGDNMKQQPLGIFYTDGIPYMWYVSRASGSLYVYEINGMHKLVAEFQPGTLLINESNITPSQNIMDSIACTALALMRSRMYITALSAG